MVIVSLLCTFIRRIYALLVSWLLSSRFAYHSCTDAPTEILVHPSNKMPKIEIRLKTNKTKLMQTAADTKDTRLVSSTLFEDVNEGKTAANTTTNRTFIDRDKDSPPARFVVEEQISQNNGETRRVVEEVDEIDIKESEAVSESDNTASNMTATFKKSSVEKTEKRYRGRRLSEEQRDSGGSDSRSRSRSKERNRRSRRRRSRSHSGERRDRRSDSGSHRRRHSDHSSSPADSRTGGRNRRREEPVSKRRRRVSRQSSSSEERSDAGDTSHPHRIIAESDYECGKRRRIDSLGGSHSSRRSVTITNTSNYCTADESTDNVAEWMETAANRPYYPDAGRVDLTKRKRRYAEEGSTPSFEDKQHHDRWRHSSHHHHQNSQQIEVIGGGVGGSISNSFYPPSFATAPRRNKFTLFFTKKYVFSNHYRCPKLTIDGNTFVCTEQYYMWVKAMTFQDFDSAEEIRKTDDPKTMKRVGSNIKGFDQDKWDAPSRTAMVIANTHKYTQNPEMRRALFMTYGTELVECNPTDQRWGIGLPMDDPRATDKASWRGQNWLGQILTKIRKKMWKMEMYKEEADEVKRALGREYRRVTT